MDLNQIARIESTFKAVFEHSARETAQLFAVCQSLSDNAIDVRVILRAATEGATHEQTKSSFAGVEANFVKTENALQKCVLGVRTLLEILSKDDYQERLKAIPISHENLSRETANDLITKLFDVKAGMLRRHSTVAAVLINFANLVRGIDSAQALLLKRQSFLKKMLSLAKPAASEVLGTGIGVPLLGFLVEFAKSTQPDVDRLLDQISRAATVFDEIFAFDDLLINQMLIASFTLDRITEALESEQAFSAKMNKLLIGREQM